MLIKDIKDPAIRALALKRAKQEYQSYTLDDSLFSVFRWDTSLEGGRFWALVNDNAPQQEIQAEMDKRGFYLSLSDKGELSIGYRGQIVTISRSFHNTVGLEGQELKDSEQKAQSQDEMVKEIISTIEGEFTASQVHERLSTKINTPLLTSVRRSITNLRTKHNFPIEVVGKSKSKLGGTEFVYRKGVL